MYEQTSLRSFIKDVLLMLHVVVFAWWVHLLFAGVWLLLLALLWWIFQNPVMIVAGIGGYLLLVLMSFGVPEVDTEDE